MIWLVIGCLSGGFTLGLYIGWKLGIKETEQKLHVISGKKATEEFRKATGLN